MPYIPSSELVFATVLFRVGITGLCVLAAVIVGVLVYKMFRGEL